MDKFAEDVKAKVIVVARYKWPTETLDGILHMRTLLPDQFATAVRDAAGRCGRVIEGLEFATLPFDFRVAEGERPYLKTLWAKLD